MYPRMYVVFRVRLRSHNRSQVTLIILFAIHIEPDSKLANSPETRQILRKIFSDDDDKVNFRSFYQSVAWTEKERKTRLLVKLPEVIDQNGSYWTDRKVITYYSWRFKRRFQ